MTAWQLIERYISFFEKKGHNKIPNAPLVPENDPTTLFTSSGMQPLVPYFLGQPHPAGKRLVNVQNCFRAADIDEVGDSHHTTFFRMLGNWSLGDYFKKEQLPWLFEFLIRDLGLDPRKLFVSVFEGFDDIPKDEESAHIWEELFKNVGIDPKDRIFYYGADKNWWSRAGIPNDMPEGEPGGPDSEVFFDLKTPHNKKDGKTCHPNCQCGRFLEIGNSVFMQYQKKDGAFCELPQKNVDFGGGLERLLAAVENKQDIFQTALFSSIVQTIELQTGKKYVMNKGPMRVVTDHLIAATFITAAGVYPSNKEQGYILRRLTRRALDNYHQLEGKNIVPIIKSIAEQYKDTGPDLVGSFEKIKNTLLEEEQVYQQTVNQARRFIIKKYKTKIGDELKGQTEISAADAFQLYSTHGLSPTQIKSLGFVFDEQAFAEKMKEHQRISRAGATRKFAGGLADQSEEVIRGHTATHLLQQALRDILGRDVYQTGSNITSERIRFDFSYGEKLTPEQIEKVEEIVNKKIRENLPVYFEMMAVEEAKRIGAIGLFDEKYGDRVKIYFIGGGPSTRFAARRASSGRPYSVEFCGGPHVDFTGRLKSFKIKKEQSLGKGQRRIYAVLESPSEV